MRPLEIEGAIEVEQVNRLPKLIDERRKNGILLQCATKDHKELFIQREIGESSWSGFRVVICPGSSINRKALVGKLKF